MVERKRKTKAGAPRTEVFAMRLDPKLKYLAEIAARKQRRSLANFMEWAIEQALNSVYLVEPNDYNNNGESVADSASKLWALDEPDRLCKLATEFPDLMTYDEQLIWRVISEHSYYSVLAKSILDFKQGKAINTSLVRNCWAEIKSVALSKGTVKELNEAIENHADFPPF